MACLSGFSGPGIKRLRTICCLYERERRGTSAESRLSPKRSVALVCLLRFTDSGPLSRSVGAPHIASGKGARASGLRSARSNGTVTDLPSTPAHARLPAPSLVARGRPPAQEGARTRAASGYVVQGALVAGEGRPSRAEGRSAAQDEPESLGV